jgi:phosphoribosylanthranilate isomerase
MTWVKICGITNLQDALTAVEAGADALGFVFYKMSPRNVSPQAAQDIIRQVPRTIEKVGVFVDAPAKWEHRTAEEVGLTGIQIHVGGLVGAQALRPSKGMKQYVALSADRILDEPGDFEDWLQLFRSDGREQRVDAVFLDSGTSQKPGGTGKVFDWETAIPFDETIRRAGLRLVVAGGLNPENVARGMRTLRPWGVDVSSGVEAQPGRKDPEKVRAFVAAVRNADKGQ